MRYNIQTLNMDLKNFYIYNHERDCLWWFLRHAVRILKPNLFLGIGCASSKAGGVSFFVELQLETHYQIKVNMITKIAYWYWLLTQFVISKLYWYLHGEHGPLLTRDFFNLYHAQYSGNQGYSIIDSADNNKDHAVLSAIYSQFGSSTNGRATSNHSWTSIRDTLQNEG